MWFLPGRQHSLWQGEQPVQIDRLGRLLKLLLPVAIRQRRRSQFFAWNLQPALMPCRATASAPYSNDAIPFGMRRL